MAKRKTYPKTRQVAKSKRLKKALDAAPKTKKKNLKDVMDEIQTNGLTMKEEIFCRCYATTREFFGNGIQSYVEAYKPDMTKKGWYNVAKNMAYRLLTKGDIMKRINELLSPEGWNHGNMDKQLLFVANQYGDLKSKVNAVREYNRVTKRVDESIKMPVSFEIIINVPTNNNQNPSEPVEPSQPAQPSDSPSPENTN